MAPISKSERVQPAPEARPQRRCTCGICPICRDQAKWNGIFARYADSRPRLAKRHCRIPEKAYQRIILLSFVPRGEARARTDRTGFPQPA